MIKLENIHKTFDNNQVLNGIDLTIAKGEVIVLIGPSGCGKSTLLRCINGLESVSEGKIWIDGIDITGKRVNWQRIRQKVGMVFQSYNLYPHLTVLDNLILSPVRVQKKNEKKKRLKSPFRCWSASGCPISGTLTLLSSAGASSSG